MNTNLRFAVAIHALTLLASSREALTSEAIAESVNTNPVVIRRAMASLRENGLVESKPGANGGWRLLREPEQINLREIFCILKDDVLGIHDHPNKDCPVGGNIKGVLTGLFSSAQLEMENAFNKHTIADILNDVRTKGEK